MTGQSFLGVSLRILFYFGFLVHRHGQRWYKAARRKAGRERDEDRLRDGWASFEPDDSDSSFSDSEDDESEESDSDADATDLEDAEFDEGSRGDDEAAETSALIRDVTLHGQEEASLLVAHLSHHHPGILTRSAFRSPPNVLRQRRIASANADADADAGNLGPASSCVVCTVEDRTIICWPCRASFTHAT